MSPPKVFISYAREGAPHDQWVADLAASLRRNGVDASIDQWDLKPGTELTLFMESRIRDSHFVILICTEAYASKSNIPTGGVGYERNVITAELLQSRDLRPKFIPILRGGDFQTALPTYLGSRFGIDFRPTSDPVAALDELLRTIYEVPHPGKPAIGPSPFGSRETGSAVPTPLPTGASSPTPPADKTSGQVSGHVESWEERAAGRFQFLRETRLTSGLDPFARGYWQASFALSGNIKLLALPELLNVLRASKTGRTGWDVGWVPSREEIAPYPFQDGIEVWLAEEGQKDPGHSDFWRAERIGTFALFRGFQEDGDDFKSRHGEIGFDYSLALWRTAEVLLYLEKFANNLGVGDVGANVSIRWTGLENRRLGHHSWEFDDVPGKPVALQSAVHSMLHIQNTKLIKANLIKDVRRVTQPLFEIFDFFSVSDDKVRELIRKLFDEEKEVGSL